jgi:hypothetical protein
MANHVNFNIQFQEINDAAKAKWKELTNRLVKDDYEYWFGDMWLDPNTNALSSEDVRQYSWTTENIGPKWSFIKEFDEDGCQGYSAWSVPEQGLQWILGQLAELDPDMITVLTYEDENPNFTGVQVYDGDELYDSFEDDYSETVMKIIESNPDELMGKWDEDEEAWVDQDAEDFFDEVMWEEINNAQWDLANSCIESIKENRGFGEEYPLPNNIVH